MSKAKTDLRFAALIRVSTEQQEQQGESLRTQRAQNERDVERLGGTVVGWYGGQEHATPGYQKKEVDRLIHDAAKGKFDAVIVAYADRWSRDNTKSTAGPEAFKKRGIRFFVGSTEYDLFNPQRSLFLGMSAVIGQFQAQNQSKKSIENRIERAKRGLPACGKLPFGRTFDAATGQWGIDPAKKAMMEDVARRYLAGEPLPRLAEEYGVNHANLHKVLTKRSGTEWVQEFHSDGLNIHETVTTTVPPLLPEATIQAIRRQVEANKTYHDGQAKQPYLFGRMVFCGHCGYAMFGQTNHNGHRYYRHAHTKRERTCPRDGNQVWVNADDLENSVLWNLFDLFGNPVAVQRAVEEATPDRDQVNEKRARLERIKEELEKVEAARGRVVDAIADGLLTQGQAQRKLDDLKGREATLKEEAGKLGAAVECLPTPQEVKAAAEQVSAMVRRINRDLAGMGWQEKRALAEMVFGGKTIEGKRMGIYIEWVAGQERKRRKAWEYRIAGRLIGRFTGPFPPWNPAEDEDEWEFMGGPKQEALLTEVTSSALYSPGTAPPARRSCGRTPLRGR